MLWYTRDVFKDIVREFKTLGEKERGRKEVGRKGDLPGFRTDTLVHSVNIFNRKAFKQA